MRHTVSFTVVLFGHRGTDSIFFSSNGAILLWLDDTNICGLRTEPLLEELSTASMSAW